MEVKNRQRHVLCTLLVAAVLVAVVMPFASPAHRAWACSNQNTPGATNGGCTITVTVTVPLRSVRQGPAVPPGGCVLASRLVGREETPPTASPASGTAFLTVDPAAGQVRFMLSAANLVAGATAAHIHQAPPGVAGPIVVPLPLDGAMGQTNFTVSGSGTPMQPMQPPFNLTRLCANPAGFYVNVHSTVYPAGEIRGQLASVAAP